MFACKLAEIAIKTPVLSQRCKCSSGHSEMKTALIILSALTSGLLSKGLNKNNIEVSFGKERSQVRPSTRFFWCNFYQGNCVSGCSGNTHFSPLISSFYARIIKTFPAPSPQALKRKKKIFPSPLLSSPSVTRN